MALIVEDGTGLADAESYCSVADLRAYCDGRGVDLTGLIDSRLEQLLRSATDYLAIYESNWQGYRLNGVQALDWPRLGVVLNCYEQPPAPLPVKLVQACALLAVKAQNGPLAGADITGAAVKRVKLGPLEKEYDTATIPGNSQTPRYPDVSALLRGLFRPSRAYQVPLHRS